MKDCPLCWNRTAYCLQCARKRMREILDEELNTARALDAAVAITPPVLQTQVIAPGKRAGSAPHNIKQGIKRTSGCQRHEIREVEKQCRPA